MWRVLVVGDVVGVAGLQTLDALLPRLRAEHRPQFVIVNGENAAPNGNGLTARAARRIFKLDVDVITLGDHWFRKGDLMDPLRKNPRLLRPANYPAAAAGSGSGSFRARTADGGELRVGVAVVQGRVFMESVDCPFAAVDRALAGLADCDLQLVEMHAEATSEKAAMAHHLDGRAAALWGTHTHVQTADERIFPGGLAFISDLGMTGPHSGIIGREPEPVLTKMRDGMPSPFRVASTDRQLCGALIDIDPDRRRAVHIERVRAYLDDAD